MLKGFSHIFKFTFKQGIKQKAFILSTVIVALLIFGGVFGINVYLGSDSKNENSESTIENIYFDNKTNLVLNQEMLPDGIQVTNDDNELKANDLNIVLSEKDDSFELKCELSEDTDIDNDDAEMVAEGLIPSIKTAICKVNGLSDEQQMLINSDVNTTSRELGEKEEGFIRQIINMTVPLISCMVVFFMVLVYGSSVSKTMVSEKNSKLMETLLVSVSPYSIAFGKILAVTCIAICQFFFWVACFAGGYFAGNAVNEMLNPGYVSEVGAVLKMIADGGKYFNPMTIIISVFTLCLGFLMYCVLAGMCASGVKKAEGMSGAMTLFQIPVFIGYFAAYGGAMSSDKMISSLVRVFPLSSAFIVPADIITGNTTVLQGVISIALILIVIVVGIIFTGKIYKKKLF